MQYKQWLDEWLENYVKPVAKHRTYTRYADIVRVHVAVALGERDMSALSPLELQRFTAQLLCCGNKKTGKGLSANSVNGIITVVQISLKAARLAGALDEYSADKIRRPKVREKRVQCFTAAEQKRMEQSILTQNDPGLYGVLLCLYSGLRIGELLALEWRDIDWANGTISVNRSCHDGKDGGVFTRITEPPKTESSCRTIPVPARLLPLLRAWQKQSRSDCVVAAANGKRVPVRTYQRTFEVFLQRLRLPHRGFHALRHTFATRALECGMDVKTLSEILGHKNAAVTLNRYAHSLPEHKRSMMDLVGNLL